jgi:hypothetical protein
LPLPVSTEDDEPLHHFQIQLRRFEGPPLMEHQWSILPLTTASHIF